MDPILIPDGEAVRPVKKSSARKPRSRAIPKTDTEPRSETLKTEPVQSVTEPPSAEPVTDVKKPRRGRRTSAKNADAPAAEPIEAAVDESSAPKPISKPRYTSRTKKSGTPSESGTPPTPDTETAPKGELEESGVTTPAAPAETPTVEPVLPGDAADTTTDPTLPGEDGAQTDETRKRHRRRGHRGGRGRHRHQAPQEDAETTQDDTVPPSDTESARPQKAVEEKAEEPKESKAKAKKGKSKSSVDRIMLVSVIPGELAEVVITGKGIVEEYYVEMVHQAKIRGNIYKGVISNIDPNLQAAFVNFGQGKNGFLQIDEIHPEYYMIHAEPEKGAKYPPIQKVLKPGQEILVQVVKEPTGAKGAFLTTWISLAGRFLVLTPGQEQIGISRKVEDNEERTRLRDLISDLNPGDGVGAIVRTVSAGATKTTMQKDLNYLKRLWKGIRKHAGTDKAPCLIYEEPDLANRSVRDYLSDDIREVWVDDASTADSMKQTITMMFPRRTGIVNVYDPTTKPLWEQFDIRKQLEQIHSREVVLPSGGRLVFDQTEALMAIDINSGKSGGKTNFESTAVRTNLEAAEEIARQLRLRDVGGQIVIDFIEMREQSKCREVEKTICAAMKNDRARHDIGRMSSFGLLEIVRQRIGSSAISISQEPCPYCNGTGMRRNLEWQSLQLLRELPSELAATARSGQTELILTAPSELGVYVLNAKRERLLELEREYHVRIIVNVAVSER